MSEKLLNELPVIPDLDTLEYRMVLAAYGQAMGHVQLLEMALKGILCLHRLIPGLLSAPAGDDVLKRVLDGSDKKAMGQALRELRDYLASMRAPASYPKLTEPGIDGLVDLRNFLAHRYFLDRFRWIQMPEARQDVIAELRYYARLFFCAAQCFKVWIEALSPIFGLTVEEVKVLATQKEPGLQEEARSGLEDFRQQLRAMGAIE